ncbi:UNVERIFIED_CONTAM: protein LURP-one-related 2 [Sesamum latifolium]|uniref:Protein LURP-one-related 2 n=1 Tax=Sesamum latifolium TaxID=2727402 RepID=A0AAW2YE03_9LAMI
MMHLASFLHQKLLFMSHTQTHMWSAPQVVANSTSTKQEAFTVWMKSLILGSNGCAVFDSDGEIVYRVDNYCHKSSNQVYVMDATGKVLFTIVKKIKRGRGGVKNKENLGFRVRKLVGIRMILGLLTGYWPYKVVVRLSEDQTCEYVMETHVSRPCCKIVDNSGGLVAEVKRKISESGIVLGEDVLTMVVEPNIDHSLIMGLVVVFGLINHKL